MGHGTKKKKNGGFAMMEMLAVAAITMILLAFGFVAVTKHTHSLKVTEMDNMAREIYLAAESRAAALAWSSKRLTADSLRDTAGGTEISSDVWYVKFPGTGTGLKDLLPTGSIDPTLQEKSFYIVYDAKAKCVKDVFFDESPGEEYFAKAFSASVYGAPGSFEDFYTYWAGPGADTSRGTRAEKEIYIGHYGGEASPPAPDAPTPETQIEIQPEIKITNGEELVLEVTYQNANRAAAVGLELKTSLTYDVFTVDLPLTDGRRSLSGDACTYTWVLDTLDGRGDGSTGNGFRKWFAGTPASFGGEFKVNAKMVKPGGGEHANVLVKDAIEKKANSLFADASNNPGAPPKAIIANLRHLQNLDQDFSKVAGRKEAYQVATIEADKVKNNNAAPNNVVRVNYVFRPIKNGDLKLYKSYWDTAAGDFCSIKNMTVTDASRGVKPGAGLFAEAHSASGTDKFKFENVRLINAAVDGGTLPAGGIAGTAANADFNGCRVYWTDTAKLEQDGKVVYKILSSSRAGGLVGTFSGGNITMSFAATTIQGNKEIGGLAGYAEDVAIGKAYADCYLKGESAALRAGGLIGEAYGSTSLTNVYSTGFIEWTNTTEESVVAGFCAKGSVDATNAYSGVYYQATGDYEKVLAGGGAQAWANGITKENAEGVKCYAAWGEGSNSGYEALKSLQSRLGSAFESKNNSANSFAYRLGKNSGLGSYEALGIVGLPHYGDWANGNQGGLPIVWIENGKELLAMIQVKGDKDGNSNIPRVKLCYGDKEINIPAGSIKNAGFTRVSSTETEVLWSVTLDALKGPHFKDLWKNAGSPPSSFGGDFSVVASTDSSTWTKKSAKASGNSLFASGTVTMDDEKPVSISGDDKNTAYIENLRHLQNLDQELSGVDGKTAAVQTADIDDDGYDGYNKNNRYAFRPIKNTVLQSYEVQEKTDPDSGDVLRGKYWDISGLKVTGASSADKSGAGLFAGVSSKGTDDNLVSFRFKNVSLKGADITSGDAAIPAGALAGRTGGTVEFINCQITERKVETADGSETVGSVVTGKGSAGGLVGEAAAGSVTFTNCKIEGSVVTGEGSAGGFLSSAGTGTSITFDNCQGSRITVQAAGGGDNRGFGGIAGRVNGTVTMNGCRIDDSVVKNADVTVANQAVAIASEGSPGGYRDCIGGLAGYMESGSLSYCSVGLAGTVDVWGADADKRNLSSPGSSRVVFVGGMVGNIQGNGTNESTFSFCSIARTNVRGTGDRSCVGGLAGFAKNTSFTDCVIGDTIDGPDVVAGKAVIDGSSANPLADYSTTDGNYSALASQCGTGGLVGYAYNNVSLLKCKAEGDVTVRGYKTTDHAGGLVGYAIQAGDGILRLKNCEVKKSGSRIPLIESGTGGSNAGAGHAGGMVGFAQPDIELTDCTADGIKVSKANAAGLRGVGGLVGFVGHFKYESGTITRPAAGKATLIRCKTIGNAMIISKGFRNRVGGLVGFAASADIRGCEVTGSEEGKVFIQCVYETKIEANISDALKEKDSTVFVGGMIGSSAPNDTAAVPTAFDKDADSGNVCKAAGLTLNGIGPRVCIGGIAGLADQTTLKNCFVGEAGDTGSVKLNATGTVMNTNNNNTGAIGGIAGYANNAVTVEDCRVINTTVGRNDNSYNSNTERFDAGGILGYAHTSGTFLNCKAGGGTDDTKVIVKGARTAGGVAGCVAGQGTFTGCLVDKAEVSSVHTSGSFAGGLLGWLAGGENSKTEIKTCEVRQITVNAANFASSEINARACAGGIAGGFGTGGTGQKKMTVEINSCIVSNAQIKAVKVNASSANAGALYGWDSGMPLMVSITKSDCREDNVTVSP